MKLRIKGNTLRLRLTKSEVAAFEENGKYSQDIRFGMGAGQTITYALMASPQEKMGAVFQDNNITVLVPNDLCKEWTSTELVGMDGNMDIGQEEELYLLIEKDFACLKPREGEDESDNYPHPNEGEGHDCC